ncbi:MAG: FAD-binding oxidoreductase [Candidatus Omnitrophica bacterium]|nr:FAD-binding oxidoreductase [Candidatus Omnitrophota bacterium]MCM8793368.1 FAD-binding oxidoreductase [Candidatus Omnitrophota bacterium]
MFRKEDKEIIKAYLEDGSGIRDAFCEAVIFPESISEAQEFLRESALKKIPVTISGARTGVTGAGLPYGGVVLATERLNKILEIVKTAKGGYAVVEPGVRIVDLDEEIRRFGLLYLPQPTENNAFIGGTLATNASGARGFKYGSTRNYVRRIKVVLSSGEIWEIKRGEVFANQRKFKINLGGGDREILLPNYTVPNLKTSAGYFVKENMDLIDLFMGQEGTLGLITEIELSLAPRDRNIFGIILFFKEESKALDVVHKIKEVSFLTRKGKIKSNLDALSLEFFDFFSLQLLREKFPQIPQDIETALLVEQEYTPENQNVVLDEWVNFLDKKGILLENSWFSQTDKEKEFFQDFRHSLPELVNMIVRKKGFPKIGTDMAVPGEKFGSVYKFYKSLLKEANLEYVIFGHIGDNHLHINILPQNGEEFIKAKNIYTEMVKKVVEMGGTVSAEHGIGKLKHKYLEIMFGKEAIKEMAYLKKQFDPALILGLDNIFPKELLFTL